MNHKNAASDLIFPEETSKEYSSFVKGLLTDCKSRLTYPKIVSHELFQDVIWDKLREQVCIFIKLENFEYIFNIFILS